MTEEEAKTKWCPHVTLTQITAMVAATIANDGDAVEQMQEASQKCIGSNCMMWRLDEKRDENMVLVPCDTGGHCGLAK